LAAAHRLRADAVSASRRIDALSADTATPDAAVATAETTTGVAAVTGDAAADPADVVAVAFDKTSALDTWLATVADAPHAFDFYAVARRIELLQYPRPRLGKALLPRDEALRFGQDAELDFAPAALSSFERSRSAGHARLGQRFLGLFGPMGPMPLHLTEYVRERSRHHGDPSAARFADIFHHRMVLLLYRAWAQAQPCVHADRADDDAYARWVDTLAGSHLAPRAPSAAVPPKALRFHVGTLLRRTRDAEGLTKIVGSYFGVTVRIEPHVGHWMAVALEDRTHLDGRAGAMGSGLAVLGRTAVAGRKVWDRQHRFRMHLGPLTYAQYESFLPGQPALRALREWLAHDQSPSLACELRPTLRGSEVPTTCLGQRDPKRAQAGQLGRTVWLGQRGPHRDRADLRLNPARAGSPVRMGPSTSSVRHAQDRPFDRLPSISSGQALRQAQDTRSDRLQAGPSTSSG
jgi:type VI secretion system protein ImpH